MLDLQDAKVASEEINRLFEGLVAEQQRLEIAPESALAEQRIWRVPADVPTIQEAIDLASTGDQIWVASGDYHENLVIRGKRILLKKDSAYVNDVNVFGTHKIKTESVVDNLCFQGPSQGEITRETGAIIELTGPAELRNLTVEGGLWGIFIYCTAGATGIPKVIGCKVRKNKEYGIVTLETVHHILHNQVSYNGTGGIFAGVNSRALIKNNLVARNRHGIVCEGKVHGHLALTAHLENNTVAHNKSDGVHLQIAPNQEHRRCLVLPWIENNNIAFNGGYGIFAEENERICPIVAYNNVYNNEEGDFSREFCGGENLSVDPMFEAGPAEQPLNEYYLRQDQIDNQCVDAGEDNAGREGLKWRTTNTRLTQDTRMVDLGYHYPIDGPTPPAAVSKEPKQR